MSNDSMVQFMVHNFRTESVDFRGTEDECIKYINEHDTPEFPLELYWAHPGEPHYKENNNELDEDGELW